MSSKLFLRVGDFASTCKGLPGIKAFSTEVQISGVGIKDGKIQYSAVVLDLNEKFVGMIGPFPAHAFHFLGACDTKALHKLIAYVTAQQSTAGARKKIDFADDERVADKLVAGIGAVPKKAKRARPKTPKAVEAHVDQKYDNSHNWGSQRSRSIAQRARDDLNDPKPKTEPK